MAESNDASNEVPLQELKTTDGHKAGSVFAAWLAPKEGLAVLTAGAGDGVLSGRQIRPTQKEEFRTQLDRECKHAKGIHCLDISPDRTKAAVAINRNNIQLVILGDANDRNDMLTITKTKEPAHCCCWSKDGKYVLAAGDCGTVKLVEITEKKRQAVASCKVESLYVRGLALDPENKFWATASADGTVQVWELQAGATQSTEETRKKIAPQVDRDSPDARIGLAWHPDGTLLAVAGQDNDVLLLERLNWHTTGYLTDGHVGPVRVIAFSPNGLYAATGGDDGRVVVWMVESKMQVAARQLPAPPSSLQWHPSANMLLCGTSGGGYAIWPSTVPTDTDSNLPSPYKSIDEVEMEADVAAAEAAAAAADADLEDDDMDDGDGGPVIKRRGLKKTGGDAGPAGDAGDVDDMLDQLDAAMEEAAAATVRGGGAAGHHHSAAGGHYPTTSFGYAARPKKPQGPIHPGSTPEDDSAGGDVAARFLAYNQMGAVVSKQTAEGHYVEVLFRDSSKHRIAPKFTDLFGIHAASLGPKGVAYISPQAGEGRPSVLLYRAFESWCGEKEWHVDLPAGEDALVVAAGSSVVAVATSKQLLRLYSLAGRQLSIMSLQGAPVALAAAGAAGAGASGAAAACEQQLAVVWAEGPPEPLNNTQQLAYTVFDVLRCSQVASGRVVLSPGASLSWLAFSQEGQLAAMDSGGILRVRTPDWGGAWVPVLDPASAKEACGSEVVWPVCIDSSGLTAVATTKKAPHPQVLPHPLNIQVPLSLPVAPVEGAPAQEANVLMAGLATAHIKSLSSSEVDVGELLEGCHMAADRASLKAFHEYCKANRQARALEVVDSLHEIKSLNGACKLALHFKLTVLAEHIQAFINQRIEWEEEQAAAAAAAQQGAYLPEEPAWEEAAAAAPMGDDNDMLQQDQASQFPGAPSSSFKAAENLSAQAAGKVPAMFGAKAGSGGAAAGAGGVKRKPTAAGIGAAAGGKVGGGSNPFARKKAK